MRSSLALINGRIHTPKTPGGSRGVMREALSIKEGFITAIGSTREILESVDKRVEVVDLGGRWVLPGFNDSHMHVLSYGQILNNVDLRGTRSVDEILGRLRARIEAGPDPDAWIIGRSWDQEQFSVTPEGPSSPFFDKNCLDRLNTQRPIFLERVCGHICVVNSRALQLLGLEGDDRFGKPFVDRDENGAPTGILRENALEWARSIVYRTDLETATRIYSSATTALARLGITSAQTDDLGSLGTNVTLLTNLFNLLRERDLLNVRINEQLLLPNLQDLEGFLEQKRASFQNDPFISLGPLKLLLDGSLGARTAALLSDYSDEPGNRGITLYEPEELQELVNKAHDAGMQVAIHSIGDGSLKILLDAIENAQRISPREARHFVVHCQVGNRHLFERMASLGVSASVQPPFISSDQVIAPRRLGRERLRGSYRLRSLLDLGIHVAAGSDAPVEDPSPLAGIWSAVTRQRIPGEPKEGWIPEERITLEQAVFLYTRAGAWMSFEEHTKGLLAPGCYGDLVVLGQNPFDIPPESIPNIPVDLTVCGGKITWRSGEI